MGAAASRVRRDRRGVDVSGHRHLIDALSQTIINVLSPLIRGTRDCALLDFPMYANVGDNAIWLGTRRALRHLGFRVVYAADRGTYDRRQLLARLPHHGVVFLQGGGNFGDLWYAHQVFREEVVAGLPDRRIIQLPQTINFRDPKALERAKSTLRRHSRLTLMVRDRCSFGRACGQLGLAPVLCPDMAFCLGPLRRRRIRAGALWLCRTDSESAGAPPNGDGGPRPVDWCDEPIGLQGLLLRLVRSLNRRRRIPLPALDLTPWLYDALAGQRLVYGRRMLSRGDVVVTDRLHGHILCVLLGIPHVLMNDRYSKVKHFYETWTKGCDLVAWADSHRTAREQVDRLACGVRT